jgi:phage baseplate assembly protein W
MNFAANGEALLVHEADTVVQDIMIRLSTYRGTLFYNQDYGSYLMDYILDEDTEDTRLAICDEIVRRVEEEPRVKIGSVTAKIVAWNIGSITAELSFALAGTESTYNLVLSIDKKLQGIRLL